MSGGEIVSGTRRPTGRRVGRGGARGGRRWEQVLQVAVHVFALVPLVLLIWNGLNDNLTANPIQTITFRTGKAALLLLVLSLACTPLNSAFGLRLALKWRRPLGLYAFMYAALHFLTFTVLDYGLDPLLLKEAIFEKRYALVGFAAFSLLVPLAITSTRGWMKRLGKRWKRLHQAVYIAGLLVIVHYLWLVKSDRREPLLWGAVIALLLVLRLPPIRRFVSGLRHRLGKSPDAKAAASHPGVTQEL
jgi:sulfoxide reductase heme-binding subunit YedZ